MRLRSFLLCINLLVFVLPLAGLAGLRIYDRQLVRQTHGELVALGSALAVSYRAALLAQLPGAARATYGSATPGPDPLRSPEALGGSLEDADPLPGADDAAPPALPPEPAATAAAAAICAQIQALREATRVGVRLVDFRGTVVCSSGGETEQSLQNRPEVARALAGHVTGAVRRRVSLHGPPALRSPSRETGWRVFLALPVVDGGRVLGAVIVSRTPLSPLKALWQDRVPLAIAAALLLCVVLLVSLLTQAVILRPLRRLIAQAQRIAAGAPDDPAAALSGEAASGPVEMGQLAQALSAMAAALASRARYVKDFTTALSHELKTPLTSMRGAVELMQEHAATLLPDQRAAFLRQLAADVARMEHLVRRTLAQVRTDALSASSGRCDPGAVLAELTARHADAALRITLTVAEGTGTAALSAEALDAIVAPLLDNARQHGRAERPAVHVRIDARRDADTVCIELRDDGPGIPPAHRERVFAPFFTTARATHGTGLGLHFARALAEAHGGTLALAEAPPEAPGAHFTLRLPA